MGGPDINGKFHYYSFMKTTFDGRQTLMVRRSFMEDDLRWKTAVNGRQPFDGR